MARSKVSALAISSNTPQLGRPVPVDPGLEPGVRVGPSQHVEGQRGQRGVRVLAHRRAGHRLPAVGTQQCRDPVPQSVEPQPVGQVSLALLAILRANAAGSASAIVLHSVTTWPRP